MKKIFILPSYILILIVWGVMGFFIEDLFLNNDNSIIWWINSDYSVRQSGYNFTNPLLECEIENRWERQKYIPFEANTINRINTEIIEKNPNVTIGLYIRNLNNGPWFWINENEKYSPASLMKVPILITFLKWIEADSLVQNKEILVNTDTNTSTQYFKPAKSLILGKNYTILELLEQMIMYSDNSAMNILVEMMPTELYNRVSKDLNIIIPDKNTTENYLSVKDVATFFRILYNSSYLNKDSSEFALNLLSRVTFKDGMRAWVPEDIVISHKFWERGYTDEKWNNIRQLHDCGIVYYTQYPYLFCMVTKWDNFGTNAKIIADTSKIVFDEISQAFPKK